MEVTKIKYPAQSGMWMLEHTTKTREWPTPAAKSSVLARFRQFFPLTIFPDELIIEEHRVIWIENKGPWTNELVSIMATDIACVNASIGPFFGHVHIKSLTGGPEILIDRLWKNDIHKIRNLVEGIALASRSGRPIEGDNIESKREILLNAGLIT